LVAELLNAQPGVTVLSDFLHLGRYARALGGPCLEEGLDEGAKHVDVALVSDFRFPGGTSSSLATEIRAQAAVGYGTGLIQLPAPLLHRGGAGRTDPAR